MKLPLGFGSIDWSDWVRGLMAAFISGGASAVTSGFVVGATDPDHFAPGSGKFFSLVVTVFATTGTLSAMAFLRTKPIPDLKTVVTAVETTKQSGEPQKTVTTVTETSIQKQ